MKVLKAQIEKNAFITLDMCGNPRKGGNCQILMLNLSEFMAKLVRASAPGLCLAKLYMFEPRPNR